MDLNRTGCERGLSPARRSVVERGATLVTAFTVAVSLCLSGCSSSPATRDDVCEKYDALAQQVRQGNGFGNPVFDAIDDLAGVSASYEGADLKADADQLKQIGDSGSTSVGELENATQAIANECDAAPLSMQALMPGS